MNIDRRRYAKSAFVVAGLITVCATLSLARGQIADPQAAALLDAEFFFTRLQYASSNRGRRRQAWLTDYPEAETHFLQGVTRLTRLATGDYGRDVSLGDDKVMD